MKQRPYVVREKVHSALLIQEETMPQGGMVTAEVLREKLQRGFAPTPGRNDWWECSGTPGRIERNMTQRSL
jgi:hypothetical protein